MPGGRAHNTRAAGFALILQTQAKTTGGHFAMYACMRFLAIPGRSVRAGLIWRSFLGDFA